MTATPTSLAGFLEATRVLIARAPEVSDPVELAETIYQAQQLRLCCNDLDRHYSQILARWTEREWGQRKQGEIAGRGVERQWRSGRETWDDATEVAAAVLDQLGASDEQAAFVDRVLQVAGVAYWRSKELKALGLNADDFRARDKGRWAIRFPEAS